MSLYSHSPHIHFVRSAHSSALHLLILTECPHPQQVTRFMIPVEVWTWLATRASRRLRRTKCRRISVIVIVFFIVFLSLTGISLSDFRPKVKHYLSSFLVLSQSGGLSRLRPLRSGLRGVSLGSRSIPAMSFPKWVGILVLLARLFSFRFRFSSLSFSHSLDKG